MIVYIACAKIMTGNTPRDLSTATTPQFVQQAKTNALQMSSFTTDQLQKLFKTNINIAQDNWLRFQHFFDENEPHVPAVFAYDGMVFQRLAPETFNDEELQYSNKHLIIGSFLYGLLRPLDLVKRYRMEGHIVLPENNGRNMFAYWKPLLTDYFIERIKADDGILINLASDEMKNLFDWKRVEQEVDVITPEFHTIKNGKLKTIVIYTKMCRGAMTRYILKNRIQKPEELKSFEYEGFTFDESAEGYQFNMR